MKRISSAWAVGLAFTVSVATAQNSGQPITASMEGHIYKPVKVPATDERVRQLKVPAGFTITKFAENLNKPRMLAVNADGTVYATDRDKGTVTMIRDMNNDGKADQQKVVATKKDMHGIALRDGKAYLMTVNSTTQPPSTKTAPWGS